MKPVRKLHKCNGTNRKVERKYCTTVWDPHLKMDIEIPERVNRYLSDWSTKRHTGARSQPNEPSSPTLNSSNQSDNYYDIFTNDNQNIQ